VASSEDLVWKCGYVKEEVLPHHPLKYLHLVFLQFVAQRFASFTFTPFLFSFGHCSKMYHTIQTSFSTFFLALVLSTQAQKTPNDIFYLTNCVNGLMQSSYAEIDCYTNNTVSAIARRPCAPDLMTIINSSSSLNYEDGTWSSPSGAPFNFTAVIRQNASTASVGTVVGRANSSSFAGTTQCVRLARAVLHTQKEVTCYSEYACGNVN